MRQATDKDIDAIYEMYIDADINPYMHHEIMDKTAFLKIFEELKSRDSFWVLEKENEVIGICTCSHGTGRCSHRAEIGCVAIKSTLHGKGYAKIFIQEVIENLKEKGFKIITLWAEADNPKAIKFYEKMGFIIDAHLPKYFKRENSNNYINQVIMSKFLQPIN